MPRSGNFSECQFIDVGAGFLRQARLEGSQQEYLYQWTKMFYRKFPWRKPRRLTPEQTEEYERRKAAGIKPPRNDRRYLFMQVGGYLCLLLDARRGVIFVSRES